MINKIKARLRRTTGRAPTTATGPLATPAANQADLCGSPPLVVSPQLSLGATGSPAPDHPSAVHLSTTVLHPKGATSAQISGQAPQNVTAHHVLGATPATVPGILPNGEGGRTGWAGLERFSIELKKGAMSAFAPLMSAIDTVSECVEIFEKAAESHKGYKTLKLQLDSLFHDLAGHFGGSTPPAITSTIVNLARGIDREMVLVRSKQNRIQPSRYIEAKKDIEEVLECYQRVQSLLERLALNANISIWKIIDEQTTRNRLDKLSPSQAAWYNSASVRRDGCTPDTRVGILEQLESWADCRKSEKIYWLNGMAGTGKTTIAYTFCERLDDVSRLAACFFCSRQLLSCRDVNLILPTISYQLACFSRPFRHALSGVLEQNPDVHTRKLPVQFAKLIIQPLLEVHESIPHDLVVVIDALDECDNDDGVGQILDTLLANVSRLPIRFLITGRPEPGIRDRMLNRPGKRELFEFHLHELGESAVRGDIKTYLQAKLEDVELPPGDLDLLVERSGALFLYAATAVRYILADNRSRIVKRLNTVLEAPNSSPRSINKHIDELYTVILQAAFERDHLDDDDQLEMRLVLGTVICAREPLTVDQMTRLLGLGKADAIRAAIRPLLSVLNLHRRNELITTLHQSFPDYMLDRNRSMSFHCDAKAYHARLAQRCFELMKVPNPPFNICGLQSSYFRDKDVVDLGDKVQEAISDELYYACCYWGAHILLAEPLPSLIQELDGWVSIRLLLWMEVMNLKQRLIDGVGMLSRVQSWAGSVECTKNTQELVKDAYAFVTFFACNPTSNSTPHIYVSALAFWPEARPIARRYRRRMRGLVELIRAKEPDQDSSLLAIRRSEGPFTCIAVAPGGAHIFSSSFGDQIYIWDVHTIQKKAQRPQEGSRLVRSAAYSSDGSRIVTGLDDGTVIVWDAHTIQEIGEPFRGHARPVCSVAYSPNGTRVASGSQDKTIRVWDAHTGEIIGKPLGGHTGAVNSVVYSPSGARIISGSDDKTIRIWDAQTGEMIGEPLQDHTGPVCSIVYSIDGARIASGSKDKTICVRDACTMHIIGRLLYHTGGVNSIAYSPDGAHLVSGSDDNTVCVWDAQTNQLLGEPFKGHTGIINSVKYLLGGSRIVSASNDKTLRIWDAHGDQRKERLPVVRTSWWTRYRGIGNTVDSSAHNRSGTRLTAEAMSGWIGVIHVHAPNGTHVVSSSNDNSLRVWDTQNHQVVGKPFRGHTDAVCSITYSPSGGRIISGSKDATIRIWDALTGRMVGKPLEGHTATVNSVACSPDGARIVSGSDDNTVCIWEMSTGRVVGKSTSAGAVNSVAFSPDGERIIAGSNGMIVYVRDGRSGRTIGEPLRGHSGAVKSVAFSPDGARIASGSRDCVIRIWDARSGRKIGKPLMGHGAAINSVIFSPDGARLISGSDDKTIRIWDWFTGQMIGNPLTGHAEPVHSISHSPDGARIMSGSQDLTIRIWDAVAGPPPAASSTTYYSHAKRHLHQHWARDQDGWAVAVGSKLLVWVPHEVWRALQDSHIIAVIPQKNPELAKLDFSHALIGDKIDHMEGVGGLHGWAWIFALEGILTVIVAGIAFFYLHDYPETARFLTAEEKLAVRARLTLDASSLATHFDHKFVWQALLDWKSWMQVVVYTGILIPVYAFSLFLPTVITGLGYSGPNAQLLSVPPYAVACILTIVAGIYSDKYHSRGPYILFAPFAIIGYAILYATNPRTQPGAGYAGTIIAACGVFPTVAVVIAWAGNNAGGELKRGIVLAMTIGFGNLGGIVSSFVYRAQDTPRFHLGHGVVIGVLCMSWVASLVMMFVYRRLNRLKEEMCVREGIVDCEEQRLEYRDMGDASPLFRYTI